MRELNSILIIYNPNAMKGKIDEFLPKIKQRLSLRFPVVDVVSSFLHDIGLNVKTIRAFLQTYGREKIIKAIEVLKQQKGIKNPAGFLRRALEEGYQLSVGRQLSAAKAASMTTGLPDDVVMDFNTGDIYRIVPHKPIWEPTL